MSLIRWKENVLYLPHLADTDRPALAYVKGSRMGILLDCGNSAQHARLFMKELLLAGENLPKLAILTHSHWDHSFGMSAMPCPVAACEKTAEKLETIITRATTNTRMRDFYDIYILEQLHGTTLNPKILHDALLATAHKRGSEKYLNQAEEVFDEVENDSVMQKLWEAYRKKFSYASDLEWDVIMKAIRRLYALCEKGISL